MDGPDRRAFEVVSAPIGSTSKEFRDVANAVGNASTLEAFLYEMHKRYPDKDIAAAPGASAPETKPAQAEPPKPPVKPEAKAPGPAQANTQKADNTPTGSILPPPKKRATTR